MIGETQAKRQREFMDLVIRGAIAPDGFEGDHGPRTVYGALLNFKDALDALGGAMHEPPYKAPPRAPVLYIKPRNTLAADGAPIVVPRGVDALRMGGTLAVVMGRAACRVREADALAYVAGYTVANDVCVPHDSYFRPSVRENCRDGFCPIGARI